MKKKRILLGIALTAASLFALSSCGGASDNNNDGDGSSDTQTDKVVVKFDAQNGTSTRTVEVTKGETVERPADPTRTGYQFLGWYKEKAGTNEWDFTKPITEARTLYAKWEQQDMVTGIELSGTYKTRFKKGDTFDATGLVVTEKHTKDADVVLASNKYTITLEDEAGNAVATNTAFTTAGFYTATVTSTDSNMTSEYDFKVTAKQENLTPYNFNPDTYGSDNGITDATNKNSPLPTTAAGIAELADGKITLTATGTKAIYQQFDSNSNSVATTYNGTTYNSRMQVNIGSDGAIQLHVASDAEVVLYAKGDLTRGIKLTNVDPTKSEKDPQACEFVAEDGDKEVMREFKYYINAGTYNINSTSGGGVNIYNFKISLYEPVFDPTAPITDLEFANQRTKFYEMDSLHNIDINGIVNGIKITSTRDEVPGNAVNVDDCTFTLYKGETQVTEFSDTDEYKVKVSVEDYEETYTINYYKATKFELTSPYKSITVKKDGEFPILGCAKITYNSDSKLYQYLTGDSSVVTVKYYTTKGKDANDNDVYSNEVDKATALGSLGTVYAEVTFEEATLPLACLSDSEAENVVKLYFEVTVANEAPSVYWNTHFVDDVNANSLIKGSKQDMTVTNYTLVDGVTVNTGTFKSDDSLDCIGLELAKKSGGEVSFVVPTGKVAIIKINAGSTNKDNATDNIYLKNGDTIVAGGVGTGATADAVQAGTTADTFKITGNADSSFITYSNLAAGTYKLGTADTSRGMRLFSFEITLADA